jgi:hypothetical protein
VYGFRGPDKGGMYTAVGAIAFEDTAELEKQFKKMIENDPTINKDEIKLDVAKVGTINVHTWKPGLFILQDVFKYFGGDESRFAFAFAPNAVFIILGPDAVGTMKDALTVKPADSPVLEMVLNPAQVKKVFNSFSKDGQRATMEAIFGNEDKLKSVMSMWVEGGKELKVTFKMDLRSIPRAIFWDEIERGAREPAPIPPQP